MKYSKSQYYEKEKQYMAMDINDKKNNLYSKLFISMYLHKQLQITGAQLTQTDHQLICSYHKTWKMSVRLTILLFQVSLELKLPLILLWKMIRLCQLCASNLKLFM
jgi:hypothetical protein